jgi:hypothetical protein
MTVMKLIFKSILILDEPNIGVVHYPLLAKFGCLLNPGDDRILCTFHREIVMDNLSITTTGLRLQWMRGGEYTSNGGL